MTPFTLTQAANHYAGTGLTRTAIRRAMISQELPHIRVGTKYLTTREAIENWLQGKAKVQLDHEPQGVRRVEE